jgi:hypothetical protein
MEFLKLAGIELAEFVPRCIPKWVGNWNGSAKARNFKPDKTSECVEIVQTPVGIADVVVGESENTEVRFAVVLGNGGNSSLRGTQ